MNFRRYKIKLGLVLALLCLGGFVGGRAQLWQSVGGGFELDKFAYSLFPDTVSGLLYVCGDFREAGDSFVCNVATWDGNHWGKVGIASSDTTCPFGYASATSIIKSDSDVFVTGGFQNFQGSNSTESLLHSTGSAWDATWKPNAGGWLEITNSNVFLMGPINQINGQPLSRVARWDEGTRAWTRFCDSLPFWDHGGYFTSSEYYQGQYFFGGNFTMVNGFKEIASWDGVQWHSVGLGIMGDSWINKLKVYKNLLFVGGEFQTGAGNASNYLATWDGQSWQDPFPLVGYTSQVRDMQIIDGVLYVIGEHFVWNGSNWQGPYYCAKYDGLQFCSFGGSAIFPRDIAGLNGHLYITTSYMMPDPYHGIAEWIGGNITDICISQPVHAAAPTSGETPLIHLSPNPTHSAFSLTLPTHFATAQIQIRDPQGREVAPPQAYTGTPVDVSALARGLYFIEVSWRLGHCVLKLLKE